MRKQKVYLSLSKSIGLCVCVIYAIQGSCAHDTSVCVYIYYNILCSCTVISSFFGGLSTKYRILSERPYTHCTAATKHLSATRVRSRTAPRACAHVYHGAATRRPGCLLARRTITVMVYQLYHTPKPFRSRAIRTSAALYVNFYSIFVDCYMCAMCIIYVDLQ